jgi:carbonic anhydrase/acetyltransferase-like protein (isoleucine patch superfamily)
VIHVHRSTTPRVHPTAFVDDSAHVIGDVEIGEDASVWFCSVVRGDVNMVRIGRGTNIQDGTIIHVNRGGTPTIVEEFVTVGHAARLHGCHIASHCLIGIGAIVLDGAELGEECLVAAGTLVPPGMKVPPRSLLMGSPAKIRREIDEQDRDLIRRSATSYVALKNDYLAARVPRR